MNKLILILILAMLPGAAFAGSHSVGVTMAKVQEEEPTCTTLIENTEAVSNHYGSSDSYYFGNTFTVSSSQDVCNVSFRLAYASGDISAKTFTVGIWSLSGNNLDTLLGSASISGSTISTEQPYTFTFASAVTLAAGTYAVTITDGLGNDSTNKIFIKYSGPSSDTGVGDIRFWGSDKVYVNPYSSDDFIFTIGAQ